MSDESFTVLGEMQDPDLDFIGEWDFDEKLIKIKTEHLQTIDFSVSTQHAEIRGLFVFFLQFIFMYM